MTVTKKKRNPKDYPFCFQEKFIDDIFIKLLSGNDLVKVRTLYVTLTRLESDFWSEDMYYYTTVLQKYSGLTRGNVYKCLNVLKILHIIKVTQVYIKGKRAGRKIIFTPEQCKKYVTGNKYDLYKDKIMKILHPPKKEKPKCRITTGSNKALFNKDTSIKKDIEFKSSTPEPEVSKNSSEKKKHYLSGKQYRLIKPLITYWNKMPNLRNIKIPEYSSAEVSSPVYYAAMYLQEIVEGRFFKNQDVDTDFIDPELRLRKINTWEFDKQIQKLNDAYDLKNYPETKKYLPKYINAFFYDPFNGNRKSYFYENFYRDVKLLEEGKLEEKEMQLPNGILDKYLKLIPNSGGTSKKIILNNLLRIYKWYIAMDKRMGLIYSKFGDYDTYFSSFNSFTDRHVLYLESYIGGNVELNPGFLKLSGKAWERFLEWIEEHHKLKLEPTDKIRTALLSGRKRKLLQYGGVDLEDFVEEGMYTFNDWELINSGKYEE